MVAGAGARSCWCAAFVFVFSQTTYNFYVPSMAGLTRQLKREAPPDFDAAAIASH